MTVADLRAEIARQRRRVYQLAAEVGHHPARLGMMLNERLPMPPELAQRLQRALEKHTGKGATAR